MSPAELQEHYNSLYEKCSYVLRLLTNEEHEELRACAANYFQQTGRPISEPICYEI